MLEYEKHQRDYPFLATAIVMQAYGGKRMQDYFEYAPHPRYILVKERILYHFFAREDPQQRTKNWIQKYGTIKLLTQHQKDHNKIIKKMHTLLKKSYLNPIQALQQLHIFFEQALPLIVASIEVPDYAPGNLLPEVKNRLLKIRVENEDIYRDGAKFHLKQLARIEEREHIAPNTLQYLTQNEFQLFIDTRKVPLNLNQRNKFVLLKLFYGNESIYFDPAYVKSFGLMDQSSSLKKITELKGTVAFPGKITGKVCIIKKIEEAHRIQEGDILVTAMTDPRYLAAMKKAAAIITNEGGITCHAAIVARELKKPCITGTKNATHVLINGIIVEVNATKGIVKIIR